MKKLRFHNVKTNESFETTKYNLTSKSTKKGKRYFAVAKNKGTDCYRIVSKDFYEENK